MDALMNASKAAAFSAAKGKKIKTQGVSSSGFRDLGDELNTALNTIGDNHDVIWIDTSAVARPSSGIVVGAIIYYVER